jgi:transcriptional regulator with XRE-family HTH domain
MHIHNGLTDDAVLRELGARLARVRLGRNLTQRDVADTAGVERKAVLRIEAGEPVKLVSLVRVLRALDLLAALDQLVPEPAPSPIELLELRGRARRRASGERATRSRATDPWRWGDDAPAGGGSS